MDFELRGSDPRFAHLRELLLADGHQIREGGIPIAPPAAREGLPYYQSEVYAIRNASLTAEGALSYLMFRGSRSLRGENILVVGYGRIGRLLAGKLQALGARVTVAARKAEARAWAQVEGHKAVDIIYIAPHWDAVINTVPTPLLKGNYGGALCLDLASAPGGWADETAVLRLPGLPGHYAPREAAIVMRDAIYETLKEDNTWKS